MKRLVLCERTFPHEDVLKSQTGVLPGIDSLFARLPNQKQCSAHITFESRACVLPKRPSTSSSFKSTDLSQERGFLALAIGYSVDSRSRDGWTFAENSLIVVSSDVFGVSPRYFWAHRAPWMPLESGMDVTVFVDIKVFAATSFSGGPVAPRKCRTNGWRQRALDTRIQVQMDEGRRPKNRERTEKGVSAKGQTSVPTDAQRCTNLKRSPVRGVKKVSIKG